MTYMTLDGVTEVRMRARPDRDFTLKDMLYTKFWLMPSCGLKARSVSPVSIWGTSNSWPDFQQWLCAG